MRLSVGSLVNGSITAVSGSGITSMSLASIACQPRIDDPSKPRPSSKGASSLNSETGAVKCCHVPSRSINFTSTMTAPFSFMNCKTCFGVIDPVGLLAASLGRQTHLGLVSEIQTAANTAARTENQMFQELHRPSESLDCETKHSGRPTFSVTKTRVTQRPSIEHLTLL